jgi:hypothetical protein
LHLSTPSQDLNQIVTNQPTTMDFPLDTARGYGINNKGNTKDWTKGSTSVFLCLQVTSLCLLLAAGDLVNKKKISSRFSHQKEKKSS